jgi:Ser/Thr protein kinase RdoA (MazF antagonist)
LAVKTEFSRAEFAEILSHYDLGDFHDAEPVSKGTVQTNFFIQTSKGRFVFRCYENRSREMVLFECDVIRYLVAHQYPCPAAIQDRSGAVVGMYTPPPSPPHEPANGEGRSAAFGEDDKGQGAKTQGKPYVIFEYVEGYHVEKPEASEREQLIQKAAELHTITEGYQPPYVEQRLNFNVGLCRKFAGKAAASLDTESGWKKLAWLEDQLSKLELPESLRKGICHCDWHFENVLFRDGEFKALLDFDHANYTFLILDLVGLIEIFAWPFDGWFEAGAAREVAQSYMRFRALNADEQKHLFDVYKLSILIDCVWYFARGDAADFYEKRKIDYLDSWGREGFGAQLFG